MHLAETTGIAIPEIISDAEKGEYHWDIFDRWQEFKKEWSQEDRETWDSLMKKVRKNADGERVLDPPLTSEEKVWAMDLARRAMEWGIC
jgi:hypothetical protein